MTSLSGKTLVFLTNNFVLPAFTISQLYRLRWRIELFFKWIKQHLRIKAFFGITEKGGQNSNLDRYLRLRARGHRQETSQPIDEPLRTLTDSKPNFVRKSSANSVTCRSQPCKRAPQFSKPIEFIQLTLGHY
jgi:Transposase DDE domain